MNKEQFLMALRRMLKRLPEDELERVLAYYREMVEDEVESGKTEEEAVSGLGDLHTLAQKILAENPNRRKPETAKIVGIVLGSVLGVVLVASLVLSFFTVHQSPGNGGLRFTAGLSTSQAGLSDTAASESYGRKTYQAKAAGVTKIDLRAKNKSVEFKTAQSDSITVEYDTFDGGPYNFSCENGTLTICGEEDPHGLDRWWQWKAPTITVSIPKDYAGNISADTTNSSVQISDFQKLGELNLQTTNSGVNATSLNVRSLQTETKNGAINLSSVSAAEFLKARTTNGAIRLNGIFSPDISLNTTNAAVSGTIRGREEDYTVEAETSNAISNLKERTGGSKKLSVKTTNAIIRVNFQN